MGEDFLTFGTEVLICLFGRSAIRSRRNYLASEISRSQIIYPWSEIWGRLGDYVGFDISSMSLSKPFS